MNILMVTPVDLLHQSVMTQKERKKEKKIRCIKIKENWTIWSFPLHTVSRLDPFCQAWHPNSIYTSHFQKTQGYLWGQVPYWYPYYCFGTYYCLNS